jgi:predicted dehydrogenase
MGKIRLAQIGIGSWGKNLLRNFMALPECELVVACDTNQKVCELLSQDPKISEVTDNWEAVLRRENIDAVVVATPPSTHAEIAIKALESGKDVFVEKPIALKLEDAYKMVEIAEKHKRILMVGHILEYHPAVVKLKEYIKAGELGRIYYLYAARLNLGVVRSVENAMWSLAPHDISIFLYLLESEPVKVSATGASYLQKGIEDISFVSLFFPDGCVGHIHSSWLDPHKMRKITVVGSKKMATFDDVNPTEKLWLYDKGADTQLDYNTYAEYISLRTGDILIPKLKMKEPLAIECEEFIKAIKTRVPPLTDGHDGIRVLRVLEAADRSMKLGGTPINI